MKFKVDDIRHVAPLTSENWDQFEELFGRHQGANGGCWCMWWRLPRSSWEAMSKEQRRLAFKRLVDDGEPVGVVLFERCTAIGWCAVTPHGALPTFERSRISKPIDEVKAWRISCFFVKAGYRRQGCMQQLIQGAIWFAKRNKAPALDAFPQVLADRSGYVDTFVGVDSVFSASGFETVEPRGRFRNAMRLRFR